MTKKTYEVTGATPYLGRQPGETFEADIDEEQEARAVARGVIRAKQTTKKKEAKDDE